MFVNIVIKNGKIIKYLKNLKNILKYILKVIILKMDEEKYDSLSDEENLDELNETNDSIFQQPEDFNNFNTNYEKLKKDYITSHFLNKYEKTRVISERAQQLANGAIPLLKNPKSYSSVYEIAMEELKQKKIPFISKRPISNGYEYWKLEDLKFL